MCLPDVVDGLMKACPLSLWGLKYCAAVHIHLSPNIHASLCPFPSHTHLSPLSPHLVAYLYFAACDDMENLWGCVNILPLIHLPVQNKTFIWCFDAHKSLQHIFLVCIIRLGQQRLRLQTVLNYKKVIESWATGITSCYDNLRSLFHLFSLSPSTHSAPTSAMKPQISHYTDTRATDSGRGREQ